MNKSLRHFKKMPSNHGCVLVIADWAHLYEAGSFEDEPMDETEENSAEDQVVDELD